MIPRTSFLYRLSKNPNKTEKLHLIVMYLLIAVNVVIILGFIAFVLFYFFR